MDTKGVYKNKYGVEIKMCCASCKRKVFKSEKTRDCELGEKDLKPSYLCPDWIMSENLDNAGRGGGRIRKKGYLQFILDKGGKTDAVIEEWEKKYGTRFLTKY